MLFLLINWFLLNRFNLKSFWLMERTYIHLPWRSLPSEIIFPSKCTEAMAFGFLHRTHSYLPFINFVTLTVQSELATWTACRALFSDSSHPLFPFTIKGERWRKLPFCGRFSLDLTIVVCPDITVIFHCCHPARIRESYHQHDTWLTQFLKKYFASSSGLCTIPCTLPVRTTLTSYLKTVFPVKVVLKSTAFFLLTTLQIINLWFSLQLLLNECYYALFPCFFFFSPLRKNHF